MWSSKFEQPVVGHADCPLDDQHYPGAIRSRTSKVEIQFIQVAGILRDNSKDKLSLSLSLSSFDLH
jgi:hypothetical protein